MRQRDAASVLHGTKAVSSGGQLPVPPALCNTQTPTLPDLGFIIRLLWGKSKNKKEELPCDSSSLYKV
jgi:hypothetical protein